MYEDYFFIKEVVPLIDNMFNTSKDKKMVDILVEFPAGGYAALHNSFRHQEML